MLIAMLLMIMHAPGIVRYNGANLQVFLNLHPILRQILILCMSVYAYSVGISKLEEFPVASGLSQKPQLEEKCLGQRQECHAYLSTLCVHVHAFNLRVGCLQLDLYSCQPLVGSLQQSCNISCQRLLSGL